MIISRAPLRITLGGGGTDIPSYYKKYGGIVITGAINKYVFVGANKYFYNNVLLKYSKIELVNNIEKIKHNLLRESLKLLSIREGIEITSLADVPARTGLGSSGAFLVALLNTLHHFRGSNVSKRQLAEEACKIEIDILKEHEGKQDPYSCSFGGMNVYQIEKTGEVKVIPLINQDIVKKELEKNLFLFYTGKERKTTASEIIKKQTNIDDYMHKIKQIGLLTKQAFENQDFDAFGKFLNEHWKIKKQYAPHSTNDFIDDCYERAMECGCLGGKIMGAGGGSGFFLFYHPGNTISHYEFINKMTLLGLYETKFKFDDSGVIVVTKEEYV